MSCVIDEEFFINLNGTSSSGVPKAIKIHEKIFTISSLIYEEIGLHPHSYYLTNQGKYAAQNEFPQGGATYHVIPRVLGGKGGFGSMLRAIGAQIEKTTSREACRDLSGRRMRDVNNEKKLKDWVSKAADREQEKEERRRQRRERLSSEPKHNFQDHEYEEQKSQVTENQQDALLQGLQVKSGASSTSSMSSNVNVQKRKATDPGSSGEKRKREWFGLDVNLSDIDSDSSEETDSPDNNSEDALDMIAPGRFTSAADNSNYNDNSANANSENSSCSSIKQDKEKKLLPKETYEPVPTGLLSEPSPPKNEDVDLEDYDSAIELEAVGLENLKKALTLRNLKCGGTLQQRAARLFSVKGLSVEEIDSSLFVKPSKGKKR